MSELKPCPFCGGPAMMGRGLLYIAVCRTPTCIARQIDTAYESEEKAARAWNRRAAHAVDVEKVRMLVYNAIDACRADEFNDDLPEEWADRITAALAGQEKGES